MVTFDWYKEHAEQLWCGLFCDVAATDKRDTAKLVVDENNGSHIAFTLNRSDG